MYVYGNYDHSNVMKPDQFATENCAVLCFYQNLRQLMEYLISGTKIKVGNEGETKRSAKRHS